MKGVMNLNMIELIKLLAPTVIAVISAWLLAFIQSKKEAKKLNKQIDDWKKNSIEAQNKTNKLLFCLNKLSEIEINYEKMISDINTVIQSVNRLNSSDNSKDLINEVMDVKMSARQVNGHMHEIMYTIGLTGELVKAISQPDFYNFKLILSGMKESGDLVEKEMSELAQMEVRSEVKSEVNKIYIKDSTEKFEKAMLDAREFMISILDNVLGKMEQGK